MIRPRPQLALGDLHSLLPPFQTSPARLRWHRPYTTRVRVKGSNPQQPPQTEPSPKTYFQSPSEPPKTYFQQSSSGPPPPPSYFQPDTHSPPPPPPRHRFIFPTYVWIIFFSSIGYFTGEWVIDFVIPPVLPPISDPDSARYIRNLNVDLNRLPIVKELRRYPEIWQESVAYSSVPPEERKGALTSGVMSGPEAIPVQRVFVNKKDNKVVNIVWFGHGVCGWPKVVHGGALATVLDETMGRVAIPYFPAQTGVTATLEIAYSKLVAPNKFYIVRAELVREGATDRKAYVQGSVIPAAREGEAPVTQAKGLFVLPKGYELRKMKDRF
ncbi:MAG: hypothetical protein M1840_007071 [Geoglossum simile]|nr:MAG: hypothetical protein M1840_007071 [Geoglossum simile]